MADPSVGTKLLTDEEIDKLIQALECSGYNAAPMELLPGGPLEIHGLTDCFNCHRDLCRDLDAYYGHNPLGAMYCQPCRKLLRIT